MVVPGETPLGIGGRVGCPVALESRWMLDLIAMGSNPSTGASAAVERASAYLRAPARLRMPAAAAHDDP